jgi:hypothetical protein
MTRRAALGLRAKLVRIGLDEWVGDSVIASKKSEAGGGDHRNHSAPTPRWELGRFRHEAVFSGPRASSLREEHLQEHARVQRENNRQNRYEKLLLAP